MSYSSPSAVGALCRNLLGEFVTWTDSSCPTRQQVDGWLSSGCSIIEARLSALGYSVPVSQGTRAYDWLSDLNTLFGVSRAELSRTTATIGPGERSRGELFSEMFYDGLDRLADIDLSSMGVSRASRGVMYAGGISVADKQTQEADTDRVKPRYERDMFRFPGVQDPTGGTAS